MVNLALDSVTVNSDSQQRFQHVCSTAERADASEHAIEAQAVPKCKTCSTLRVQLWMPP